MPEILETALGLLLTGVIVGLIGAGFSISDVPTHKLIGGMFIFIGIVFWIAGFIVIIYFVVSDDGGY